MSNLSASSYLSRNYKPSEGRLNNKPKAGMIGGSWCSNMRNDSLPFLQVDLGVVEKITKVVTQGHPVLRNWVSQYKILYSSNGVNWEKIRVDGQEQVSTVNYKWLFCLYC